MVQNRDFFPLGLPVEKEIKTIICYKIRTFGIQDLWNYLKNSLNIYISYLLEVRIVNTIARVLSLALKKNVIKNPYKWTVSEHRRNNLRSEVAG